MIRSRQKSVYSIEKNQFFGCITYSNSKLGPRLVGTAQDWQLNNFSKEVLFSVIHDSLSIRNKRSLIFIKDKTGKKYRVYVFRFIREFFDYHYNGNKFSFCVFVPNASISGQRVNISVEDFNWIEYIKADGSVKKLADKFLQSIKIK